MKRRPIQLLEQAGSAARALAKRLLVELLQKFANRLVELGEAEELPMPQRRHDPALDHQHPRFDLGLVAGLVRACRQNANAIMAGHFLIGRIEVRFVTASAVDAALRVIGDDQPWNRTEKFKGADVSAEPVFQALAPGGFGIGVSMP